MIVPRIRISMSWTDPPALDPNALQHALREAMGAGSRFVRALWLRRAQDLNIRHSGAYLRGIEDGEVRVVSERTDDDRVTLEWELVNRAPHAGIVEHGHPAFHLPSRINWSGPRVKRGKNGPYLHIPFEHSAYQTPAQREASGMTMGTLRRMLPAETSAAAQRLARIIPQRVGPIVRSTPDGRQQFLAADRYSVQGSRSQATRLRDRTPGPRVMVGPDGAAFEAWRGERTVAGRDASGARLTNPAWRGPKLDGLFKSGPKGHTKYLTIRTITPRSAGWNIPAQVGHGVARQVQGAVTTGPGSERFRQLLVEAASRNLFK